MKKNLISKENVGILFSHTFFPIHSPSHLEDLVKTDADTLKTICNNSNETHGHALQYETSISLSPR